MHLDLDDAVALAGFAASALDVEAEAVGVVSALLRGERRGEDLPNGTVESGEGRHVRARRPADGRRVDRENLVEEIGVSIRSKGRTSSRAPM